MTRLLAVALALACVQTQKPVERDPAKLWIDATFVDSKGTPVTDVRKEEIEVWIGHFLVPVEDFISVTPENDAGRGSRLMVLLLDDITLPYADVPRVKDAAKHLVSQMRPGDRMAVATLSGTSVESTDDRARLLGAIDRYNVRATGIFRSDQLGVQVLETMTALARHMAEAGDQRKTIVALGRAEVFDRPLPPPAAGHDLLPEWVEAMRVMALANVSLYVIDAGGVGSRRFSDSGDSGFARATGGRAYIGVNNPSEIADKVLREVSNYYLIGVKTPPTGHDSDLRELQIKITRKGITVHTREAVSGGR